MAHTSSLETISVPISSFFWNLYQILILNAVLSEFKSSSVLMIKVNLICFPEFKLELLIEVKI